MLAGLPTNTLVPKGARLVLVGDDWDGAVHLHWFVGATRRAAATSRTGAPVVNQDIKGGSATVGPFKTPDVYHLYRTMHHGMTLTVLAQ
jgi:hypothetical protein